MSKTESMLTIRIAIMGLTVGTVVYVAMTTIARFL